MKVLLEVPQWSILGSLLFNILINVYFTQDADICNFAGVNSLYSIEDKFKDVKTMLKKNLKLYKGGFMRTTSS